MKQKAPACIHERKPIYSKPEQGGNAVRKQRRYRDYGIQAVAGTKRAKGGEPRATGGIAPLRICRSPCPGAGADQRAGTSTAKRAGVCLSAAALLLPEFAGSSRAPSASRPTASCSIPNAIKTATILTGGISTSMEATGKALAQADVDHCLDHHRKRVAPVRRGKLGAL